MAVIDQAVWNVFEDHLFTKGYLVNYTGEDRQDCVRVLYTLANVFGIRVKRNPHLAVWRMAAAAQRIIGTQVPEPFYTGFPQSVLKLTEEQRLIDQLIHYSVTYGLGDFSQPGHSRLEEEFRRLAFREKTEIREFDIVEEDEALKLLAACVSAMLSSARPLSRDAEALAVQFVRLFPDTVTACPCKDTAIRLLMETRNLRFARFLRLPDIIRLADEINYAYGLPPAGAEEKTKPEMTCAKKLNLRNRDRKLISDVIDHFFSGEIPDIRECYEKRRLWAGLLHHIHYRPKNEVADSFVQAMRGRGKNKSVLSAFEAAMAEKNILQAADLLAAGKGIGAAARSLNYMLSRCQNETDADALLSRLEGLNPIILIQMIAQYRHYRTGARTFRFVRRHMLTTHLETKQETEARCSVVPERVRERAENRLREMLMKKLAEKAIGKVYVEDGMEKIAVPLQEGTGSSGYGVLSRGSRVRIPEGNKLRCFTYWEKVDDIDLACFGLGEDGAWQEEFSWRTMWDSQDQCITFSGDETSGYNGGSEFFDVRIPRFREVYPDIRYLVFTDNVYSGVHFDTVPCTAGYMIREEEDSGGIFEPKTVRSSFRITVHSTYAVLFALDLKEREIVWLNLGMNSSETIAGDSEIATVLDYLDAADIANLRMLFRGMATETVDRPEDADVIVADHYSGELREGQRLIRSTDHEKIFEYLNGTGRNHNQE